jgi:hypothetical protein
MGVPFIRSSSRFASMQRHSKKAAYPQSSSGAPWSVKTCRSALAAVSYVDRFCLTQ